MNRIKISVNRTENMVNRLFWFGSRFTLLSNPRLRLTENRLTDYFSLVQAQTFLEPKKWLTGFRLTDFEHPYCL